MPSSSTMMAMQVRDLSSFVYIKGLSLAFDYLAIVGLVFAVSQTRKPYTITNCLLSFKIVIK